MWNRLRWQQLSLRARIFLILAALMVTTLTGGVVTMWYSRASDSLFTSIIDKNVASFQTADELENALIMQKGFLTYFFLDGDAKWLDDLNRHHRAFTASLAKARKLAYTVAMVEILDEIDSKYHTLREVRERVITLYKNGDREAGARLHEEVRQQFYAIYGLCERAKLIQDYAIARARTESQARARFINTLALVVMPVVAVMGLLLAYILIKQILQPIRRLALKTGGPVGGDAPLPDEVTALSRGVHNLMEDMDQAQSQLERSQEHLLQAEKLALVGKLAAGVAHSIRNPLSSVNMRLFVLKRSLKMTPDQIEDFEVISEEIKHIDRIVEDFLGFSRPPKLKMQRVSPSDVVDSALQLLRHRLESYDVRLELSRDGRLPEIPADPEQLKEVLVNLLINACEAMSSGGLITIQEDRSMAGASRAAVIKVSDNGPGMSESLQEKVFQPFFSTKEEGTGLGLSIASRIVEEHGGSLRVQSKEGQGTTFTITLPFKEGK